MIDTPEGASQKASYYETFGQLSGFSRFTKWLIGIETCLAEETGTMNAYSLTRHISQCLYIRAICKKKGPYTRQQVQRN